MCLTTAISYVVWHLLLCVAAMVIFDVFLRERVRKLKNFEETLSASNDHINAIRTSDCFFGVFQEFLLF